MGTPLAEERNYIQAVSAELESYLLSGVHFWQLSGSTSLPPLTPGYVMLFLKRLIGWPWVGDRRNEVETWAREIQAVCERWKSLWQARVACDYARRLRLWADYINNLDETSPRSDLEYRWKVRWRTMITLLNESIDRPEAEDATRLIAIDNLLRRKSRPGKFIWEAELQAEFPPEPYWYLYVFIS